MTEAHAKGMALQVNYLLDQGGFRVNQDGTFTVDLGRVKRGTTGLTRELMTLQARGDYAAARALMDRLVVIRPEVQAVLDRLAGVPVDIRPRFVTARELMAEWRLRWWLAAAPSSPSTAPAQSAWRGSR
jgi:hypothetical protein